jgi:exosortase J
MMFAPDFGMMIVPGCNGVRGAITLGYLALIFGYARRLKPGRLSLVALAGLLLGYAFNLLRLCMLVVYYRIGLSVPSIQKHGVGVDYAIGCTLFLFGALGIGMLIRSLETRPTAAAPQPERKPEAGSFSVRPPARSVGYATAARALCFFVLTLVFIVPAIRTAASVYALRPNEKAVIASLPAKVGPYRLLRTYAEHDSSGMIVLAIGEYSGSPGEGSAANNLTLGLWVGSGNHFVAACRVAQGVGADWTGAFDAVTPPALPVHFATSFYDDGISRQYDAETACSESGCSGYVAGSRREGFFVVAPTLSELVFTRSGKRLPILLRREWPDRDSVPSATLRAHFESDARLFMKELDLRPLVQEYGSQP